MRIGGLASGMDIDTLVEQLMTSARTPLDKIEQKKTYTEWQRDDYREMNTLLLDLDTTIFNGVAKEASYIKKTVNISDPDAISVKNVNSTIDFTGTVEIKKLATAATIKSGVTGISNSASTAKSLGIKENQTIKISAITKDGVLGEATEIIIKPDDTIDTIIANINKTSGVTAFFDNNSKKISFIAKNTGEVADNAEIVFEDDNSASNKFFADILKVPMDNKDSGLGTRGTNAEIIYNGLDIKRSSNTFTINGVEITAKKVTSSAVSFSSTPDVDGIVDTITQFVNKYNEVIEKIREKTTEKKYSDYPPLTDVQKEAMEDEEIEKWEKFAKSGTLRNDSILNSVLSKMRSNFSNPVSGTSVYSQLSQIGIKTTSNYLDGGKLTIDETKLREKIAADPNAIYELFQADGTTSSEQGIARRLRATLSTAMSDIKNKAGKTTSSVNNTFTLGKQLNNYQDQIDRWKDKLETIEDRYWARFTAMETAINKANSQSSYLSSYFS